MEHKILVKPKFLCKKLRQSSWLIPKYYEEEKKEQKERKICHFMPVIVQGSEN